jgi:hypothetical protein
MLNINSGNGYQKVFRNEREDGSVYFTTSISNKQEDGTYKYMSKSIKFKKGEEPPYTCNIKIKNAFMSFYESGDKKYDYIMVMDYETDEEEKSNKDFYEPEEDVSLDMELNDLPF